MNKLYILGALALANVEAAISFGAIASIYTLAYTLPSYGVVGTYTYTTTGDCYSAGTVTSLGMNNIYHQYYSFTIAKGTATFATATYTVTGAIPATASVSAITAAYAACYHTHLYNWLAQPQVAATTVTGGFGNSAIAYGYAMSGTAVTSCIMTATIYASLFKSNIFTGAQFQSSSGTWTGSTALASSINIVPFWGKVGPGMYYAKAATALTFLPTPQTAPAIATSGLVTASA